MVEKRKTGNERPSKPKWYYDACTLDRSKGAYGEMFNSHHPIQVVISHLAFGEAYANAHLKGLEQVEAFVLLMGSLSAATSFDIVQNDGCEKALDRIREVFPALKITDAFHLAIAIHAGCQILRTTDRDLYGLASKEVRQLGQEFGISSFAITQMM